MVRDRIVAVSEDRFPRKIGRFSPRKVDAAGAFAEAANVDFVKHPFGGRGAENAQAPGQPPAPDTSPSQREIDRSPHCHIPARMDKI